MWAVAPENYGISVTAYTQDGFQTDSDRFAIANDSVRGFALPYDVDYAGGTVLVAGDAGMVLNSIDGANFFYNDAAGALATTPWRAVGLASGTQGAIGGVGGKLALTTTANTVPDLIAPTGTISISPATPRSGRPATFTLNAADTGGSGIDPASIRWTSAGLADQTGNPVSFTFPAQGFATVDVRFADRAGNTADGDGELHRREGLQRPARLVHGPRQQALREDQGPLHPRHDEGHDHAAGRRDLRGLLEEGHAADQEGQARDGPPQGEAALQGVALALHVRQEVKLRRKKVGKTKKLRLTVSHPGNSVLRKSSKKLTLVIKK